MSRRGEREREAGVSKDMFFFVHQGAPYEHDHIKSYYKKYKWVHFGKYIIKSLEMVYEKFNVYIFYIRSIMIQSYGREFCLKHVCHMVD